MYSLGLMGLTAIVCVMYAQLFAECRTRRGDGRDGVYSGGMFSGSRGRGGKRAAREDYLILRFVRLRILYSLEQVCLKTRALYEQIYIFGYKYLLNSLKRGIRN